MSFDNIACYVDKIGNNFFSATVNDVGELNETFSLNHDYSVFGFKLRYFGNSKDSGNLTIKIYSSMMGLSNYTFKKINNVPPKVDIYVSLTLDIARFTMDDIVREWENLIETENNIGILPLVLAKNDRINIRWLNENNNSWRLSLFYRLINNTKIGV